MRNEEDFNLWNIRKQELNELENSRNVQVGQIRRYYCGVNIGNEIGKGVLGDFSRVGLVLKTNLKNDLVLIAPLSTKLNNFSKGNTIRLLNYDTKAWIICNQICMIDRRRFSERRPFIYSRRFVKKVISFYQKIIRL